MPFGFLVQPFAEEEIPCVDYGEDGPFRCQRCKAYVNPNMVFKDGGMTAECNFCTFVNDVPVNYQSALNECGQRRDKEQRSELQLGAYEFKAPQSYCARKPLMPTYVFVIDVSQFSLPIGFFQQVVQSIKMSLDYLANPEHTQLCIITYDTNIHFYHLSQDVNGEPNILWVSDVQDPFVPLPKDKLMLNLANDRERIDIFLDKLLLIHNTQDKPAFICTGAAIQAAK